MATYYLDGTTLTNSTSAFTDIGLTTCATDGFYSDGVISRELVNCSFLPGLTCVTCAQPCDGTISASENQGCFILDIDLGGTNNDVGAAIITFNPASIPDGIIVNYNSQNYNKLVSPTEGVLQANNAGTPVVTVPTFIGRTGSQGNCGSNNNIEGTYSLAESEYLGGQFIPTGNTQTITIDSIGNRLTAASPGSCKMVIPKPTGSPNSMQIQVYGPCGNTAWSLGIDCPTALNSFQGSVVLSSEDCTVNPSITYYHVPLTGTAAAPGINDMIFIDVNGVTPAADGIINVAGNPLSFIQVQNGVVISTGTCVGNAYNMQDCTTSQLWTANKGSYNFSVGDVVQYQLGDPGSGAISCATITDIITRTGGFNATIASAVAYACDDTVHCP